MCRCRPTRTGVLLIVALWAGASFAWAGDRPIDGQ
jgi:hypothetical protein